MRDLLIIGSGPAGLTAAIYAARARLNPLLIAGSVWGGQLMSTTDVENFPGFVEGIKGPELIENMMRQAQKFGAEIKFIDAIKVDVKDEIKKVYTNEGTFESRSIIIATGAQPRKLGIKGEQEFWGRGVSSCATCDGAFYKDKIVAVVGGGDTAMEEAEFLTRFASKVYLIHRRDQFRASKIMVERAKSNTKIEFILNTEVKEILGVKSVEKLRIYNNQLNLESDLFVSGLFLAVGHIPMSDFLQNQLDIDEEGYVITKNEVYTNIEGVFVAGDVEDKVFRQAITAAGSGAKAAIAAERWLSSKSNHKIC
ncbi:thioredoxin-disulfide reductase [Candidatus Dojkabacteria bacterium]|uniref:Thioredoxin reductase n=1 Tax=Candidatus Dojkabacteria bacterium TaxID=2099670 RepID=A0A3M0Z016_9BACT|nr:MAG: thioredoxin-disulfide reductase [Candidatus Dojkabacteria bacterium]